MYSQAYSNYEQSFVSYCKNNLYNTPIENSHRRDSSPFLWSVRKTRSSLESQIHAHNNESNFVSTICKLRRDRLRPHIIISTNKQRCIDVKKICTQTCLHRLLYEVNFNSQHSQLCLYPTFSFFYDPLSIVERDS